MTTPTLAIELAAAVFGVAGTFLLALNGPRAGWGFVAYLASNAGWIAFAWIQGHWGLLAQQIAFTAASLFGIWRWLLAEEWPHFWRRFWLYRHAGDTRRASLVRSLKEWGVPY